MDVFRISVELNCTFVALCAVGILNLKKNKSKKAEIILLNAVEIVTLILLSDIADAVFSGNMSLLGRIIVPVSNFLFYLLQQILIIVMALYIHSIIENYDKEADRSWLNFVYLAQGICILGIMLSPFLGTFYYIDSANVYQRGDFFLVCSMLSACGTFAELYKVVQYRNKVQKLEFVAMISYIAIPVVGQALQIVFRNYSCFNVAVTIAVTVLIILHEYKVYVDQRVADEKLAKSRAYLLNSQIKPHFLFNSLSVIQSLIEDEPETAQTAIGHLSKYLRKNLDLELSEKPVSIWEELEFTQNYLYMEKLRFGDKINIKYEVDDEIDFKVPFLSMQTIVENAIRHGIRKKVEGGTVLIRILEEEDFYKYEILDNGVGFDSNKMKEENKDSTSNGIGMDNVKERLKLLCNGEMEIQSAPGHGTRVSILIPKR